MSIFERIFWTIGITLIFIIVYSLAITERDSLTETKELRLTIERFNSKIDTLTMVLNSKFPDARKIAYRGERKRQAKELQARLLRAEAGQ